MGELSPYNIRINHISQGFFKTAMTEANINKVRPHIPTGSAADPEDMNGLILYLSSNKASRYVKGFCFTIDGGISWGGTSW